MSDFQSNIYDALLKCAENIKNRLVYPKKLKVTRVSPNTCIIEEKSWLQSPSFILIITILPDCDGFWHIYCTANNRSVMDLAKKELEKFSAAQQIKRDDNYCENNPLP